MAALLLALFFAEASHAQIEEIRVATGPPCFGKQPCIRGNLIVWKRCPVAWPEIGTIEFRDISRMDHPIIEITDYDSGRGGPFLTSEYLFWGGGYDARGNIPIVARAIDR